MVRHLIPIIKSLIALLLLVLVVFQVWLLPAMAQDTARANPEFAYLRVPVLVLAILLAAAGEVVLVCLWALLTRVSAGRIFQRSTVRWVDAMIAAGALGVLACAAVAAIATSVSAGPVTLWSLAGALVCLGFGLVVLVVRSLLMEAIADRGELEGVI